MRKFSVIVFILLANAAVLWEHLPISEVFKAVIFAGLYLCFVFIGLWPRAGARLPRRLKILGGGSALLWMAAVCCAVQIFVHMALWELAADLSHGIFWLNIGISLVLIFFTLANAVLRLFWSSGQIGVFYRLLLIFMWWIPVVNIILITRMWKISEAEFRFGVARYERNLARQGDKVCKTKYPLLLVHGIFFRDWKIYNYWGRIPAELLANGAKIFYGNQESSASVEDSAEQLKRRILEIIEETGCERVNIIAHSKGGIDARYAISALGMDAYVASLTTINTPHRGCLFARYALEGFPKALLFSVSKRYDKLFKKLGDDTPDFFSGASELTDKKCEELNRALPNCEGVFYRSVGSTMSSSKSADFPLNISHSIILAIDGENDGLVTTESMPWGQHTQISPMGPRGISHGDLIDLTRRDVPGFDVTELYVSLASELREKGL